MKRPGGLIVVSALCILGFIGWALRPPDSPSSAYKKAMHYYNTEQFGRYYDSLSARAQADAVAWAMVWMRGSMHPPGREFFVDAVDNRAKKNLDDNAIAEKIMGDVAALRFKRFPYSARMVKVNGVWKLDTFHKSFSP